MEGNINNNKNSSWKLLIIIIIAAVGSAFIYFSGKENIKISNEPIDYYDTWDKGLNIASGSNIDIIEIYGRICGGTHWVVDQCKLVVEAYPEKYKHIKPKLDEYNIEMSSFKDVNEAYIKSNYNSVYLDELLDLIERNNLDEEIPKDYEEITKNK